MYLPPRLIFGVFNREKSLQFHFSSLNCFWHSSLAMLSAYLSRGTMSGWSRQIYVTWSNVSNIAKHSLALSTGAPTSGSRNTVTDCACVVVEACVVVLESVESAVSCCCCALEEGARLKIPIASTKSLQLKINQLW